MSASSVTPLTLSVLQALLTDFMPYIPPRFIVGVPGVGDNEVLEIENQKVTLIGETVYARLTDLADVADSEKNGLYALVFGGIPIEKYGTRSDHFVFRDMVWGLKAGTDGR